MSALQHILRRARFQHAMRAWRHATSPHTLASDRSMYASAAASILADAGGLHTTN